jgi:hypothetical protein
MTGRRVIGLAVMGIVAIGLFPVVSTQQGAHAVDAIRGFLEFYSGVFALLAFTGSVVWGLTAAERILPPRNRIIAQGVHRMFGVLGLGFLGTHIVLQILAERAGIIDAVLPFLDTRARIVATGLGTIASDLMIVVFAIGVARWRFATVSRPWMWRVLHGIAYLSWPLAIVHGLTAGRPPAGWVTASYLICLVVVLVALLIRLVSPFPATRTARRAMAAPGDDTGPQRNAPRRPAEPRRAVRSEARPSADTGPQPPARTRRQPPARTRRQPPARTEPEPTAFPEPQPAADTDPRLGGRRVPPAEWRQPAAAPPQRPAADTGPRPRPPVRTGPPPGVETGPPPRVPTGRQRRIQTGPEPRVPTGPTPRAQTGPQPRAQTGPTPRVDSGPQPVVPGGTPDAWRTGPQPIVNAGEQTAVPARPREEPQPRRRPRPRLTEDDVVLERWPWRSDRRERWRARQQVREAFQKRIAEIDSEEVEFWAALRAETSGWIRRGRR